MLYSNSIVSKRPPKAIGSSALARGKEPPSSTAPRRPLDAAVAEIAVDAVRRALPESWAVDFADRFEAGWQKAIKNGAPAAWPASFRDKLLGDVYREFLDRLRAEELSGPLLDQVERALASEPTHHMTRAQVKRLATAAATRHAEAWIEPLLEEAAMCAAARIEDEIQAARAMIRRIRQLRPKELHRFASQYNWDDGYLFLFEIVRSPNCALGTAVMLYRLGRPHCFLQYSSRRDVPRYCIDNYDLLIEIEERIRRGELQDHAVRYDTRLAVVDPKAPAPPQVGKRRALTESRVHDGGGGKVAAPLQSSRQVRKSAVARRTMTGPTGPTRAAR